MVQERRKAEIPADFLKIFGKLLHQLQLPDFMAVNAKHLATFILGAAAGVALNKYAQSEDGQKLMTDLKEKGMQLKTEAEGAVDHAPDYFDNLKAQLADMLKANFPDAEASIDQVLGKKVTPHDPPAEG